MLIKVVTVSIESNDDTYYLSTDDYNKARSLTEDNIIISTDQIDINDILDQWGVDFYYIVLKDIPFSVEYETGKTIGNDSEANLITHIYNQDDTDVLGSSDKGTVNSQ